MHRPVGILTVLFLALALTACGTVAENPTPDLTMQATFSQPDLNNDYPHVVSLMFVQNGEGYYSCTGTLLSSTVVLTAGHCVEGGGYTNDETFVRNEQNAYAGIENYVDGDEVDAAAWLEGEWIRAKTVVPHPQYSDYAEFPNTYDVGVVILSEPIELDTYGQLPQEGLLDELLTGKNHRDRLFTIVGYGQQGEIPAFNSTDFERYFGQTTLININSYNAGDEMTAVFTNNPGKGNGQGGACYGDSGGPLFYDDSYTIGAIVSFGFTPCIGPDFQFRMDTETALDFVQSYLD